MTEHAIADPYWSRAQDRCELVTRQDPVVWNDFDAQQSSGALSPADIQKYANQGFHHALELFSAAEAAEFLQEAERLAAAADRSTSGVVMEPGNGAVRSLFRLHVSNDLFRGRAGCRVSSTWPGKCWAVTFTSTNLASTLSPPLTARNSSGIRILRPGTWRTACRGCEQSVSPSV